MRKSLALLSALWITPALAGVLPEGQQVVPPYGFIGFCLRNVADCEGGTDHPSNIEMTAARWLEINQVNDYVNGLPEISDEDNYGVAEKWAYPNERGGDCEDLALLKRKMLIARGWPADALLLTVAKEWNGESHAVLTVVSAQGEFVLDNKSAQIVPVEDAPYIWLKRQSRMRPYAWVNLDPTSMHVASAVYPPLGAPVPFIVSARRMEAASVKP